MSILKKEDELVIEDSTITFKSLLEKSSKELAELITGKQVIILPSHGHEDVFYTGTLDILDFLKNNGLEADIYATDDDYKELGLHSADTWLGSFLISGIILPCFINLMTSYIYDKIKAKDGDNISFQFLIENKNGETKSIRFSGDAKSLEKVLSTVENISHGNKSKHSK